MRTHSISKSLAKSMGCETHFAATYLDPNSTRNLVESSDAAQSGTNFHEYRQRYVDHLVQTNAQKDPDWAYEWMALKNPDDDSREMIQGDIARFEVNPTTVFGTEVLLSVDENFMPMECETDSLRGRRGSPSYAKAIIDLLELTDDEAVATDLKTTWTAKTDEYEAEHIAALVFAHFQVQRVRFRWEFIRLRGLKEERVFDRAEYPLLQTRIRRKRQEYDDLITRFQDGQRLTVNPFAGVCVYCTATCPLRQAVNSGTIEIPPIQTRDDARVVASKLYPAQLWVETARGLLREWVEENGPLDLGNGYELGIKVTEQRSYPLPAALKILGVEVPDSSARWDVPLTSLAVSGLREKAKAKKRAGLSDELASVAKISTSASLEFRKRPISLTAQLEMSLEQLQQAG